MSYNDLRKGRHSAVRREYFITTVVRQRVPVFTDFYLARAFIKELKLTQHEGLASWLAWVVLPDHFHALLRLESVSLGELMRRLNGRSARVLNRLAGQSGGLWQFGYYDRALRAEESRIGISRYIVANPLRAGWVANAGDYPHWDSCWL